MHTRTMLWASILLALCALLARAQSPDTDEITSLPGFTGNIPFKQYSGYSNVFPATGRNLFYWFVESQGNPATDPVVLWLNGGPGCSSLGGFFEELGPFSPLANGTLAANPYSWNTVANVIFLESPSGVGFSYSTNESDYTVGDVRTSNDSYTFLLSFFKNYPQFAKNPFWITGESYGGHYVPNLTNRIMQGNKQNPSLFINIQGFMVGNAWTNPTYDNYGAVYYWYTHALISETTFNGLNTTCDFSNIGPLTEQDTDACDDFQTQATTEMGDIDIYDIYSDICLSSSHAGKQLMRHLAQADDARLRTFAKHVATQYDPCVDTYLTTYLNNADVKQALHANMDITWVGCSAVVNYSYTDLLTSMFPVYKQLLGYNTLRMLVYSGDVDGIVPVTGTRAWLDALNLPIVAEWTPWTGSSGQVAGYVTQYDGLYFTTIRNAGHLVPGTQPQRALDMFSKFLVGPL